VAGLKEVTERFALDRKVGEHLDLYGLVAQANTKSAAVGSCISR
jgi:hypothetical protein